MAIQSLIFLLLTTSNLFASGGMFGFSGGPCPDGGSHDTLLHRCVYCPQGTQLDTFSKEVKRCIGVPLLGAPCPQGKDAQFDDQNNLCIYCAEGYIFSPDHKYCYQ